MPEFSLQDHLMMTQVSNGHVMRRPRRRGGLGGDGDQRGGLCYGRGRRLAAPPAEAGDVLPRRAPDQRPFGGGCLRQRRQQWAEAGRDEQVPKESR